MSSVHKDLVSLPPPKDKVYVAVYKFRDQTGQYKSSATGVTWSTAVTQGASSMLNKTLEDSKWFLPLGPYAMPGSKEIYKSDGSLAVIEVIGEGDDRKQKEEDIALLRSYGVPVCDIDMLPPEQAHDTVEAFAVNGYRNAASRPIIFLD